MPSSTTYYITHDYHRISRRHERMWRISVVHYSSYFTWGLTALFLDFLSSQLLTVSDGSCDQYNEYGAVCWIIQSYDESCCLKGYCIVPGRRSLMASYRAECSGLLGISICLWGFATIATYRGYTPDRIWKILVACDGYSALDCFMNVLPERLSTSHKQYTLIAAILGIWKNMSCDSFPVHVKGHQGRALPPSRFSRLEHMNISVDCLAKVYCIVVYLYLPLSSPVIITLVSLRFILQDRKFVPNYTKHFWIIVLLWTCELTGFRTFRSNDTTTLYWHGAVSNVVWSCFVILDEFLSQSGFAIRSMWFRSPSDSCANKLCLCCCKLPPCRTVSVAREFDPRYYQGCKTSMIYCSCTKYHLISYNV